MNLYTIRCRLFGCCLCFCVPGCLGWFEGATQQIGYVLNKGDSDAIGKWALKQTDAGKIWDGLCALDYKMARDYKMAHSHESKEVMRAMQWYVLIIKRVEDWPEDRTLPTIGEGWTTRDFIRQAFSNIAFNACMDPISEKLFYRLRPDQRHARWLPEWEKSLADLERQRSIQKNSKAKGT